MEGLATAQPWQIVFLLIGCTVVMSLFALWLFSGERSKTEPVILDPMENVKTLWVALLHWRPIDMSSGAGDEDANNTTVPPVVTTRTAAEQLIVTPNNEYNKELSNSFDTTAKSIAAMYQKGVITNLSKAICAAYGCTVQSASKPDSTYQLALKAVNKYLPKSNAPQFRMTPEMENAREVLGLNKP